MTEKTKRPLHVFLCHASEDKPTTRELYQLLVRDGISVWLDEEELLPGQDWEVEIEKAIENADAVIVCLSNKSVSKEGYVQKELRYALDIALEKPEGTIFIVPLKLEDCQIPRRLRLWQWVAYFPTSQREKAYERLLRSLRLRADSLGYSLTQSVFNHQSEPKEFSSLKESTSNLPEANTDKKESDFSAFVPVKQPHADFITNKVLAQPQYKVSASFLLFWIIVSLIGVFIGSSVMYSLNLDFYPFLIMGLIIGLGQWMLLRKRITRSGWWVLASGVGLSIAGIWGSNRELYNGLYVGILYGIIAGVGQWLILRKQVANAERWIVLCAIGWGAAWSVGWWFTWQNYDINILYFSLIAGLVGGVSTGGMMVWLLNQRHRN